jgi:hypothetical protein
MQDNISKRKDKKMPPIFPGDQYERPEALFRKHFEKNPRAFPGGSTQREHVAEGSEEAVDPRILSRYGADRMTTEILNRHFPNGIGQYTRAYEEQKRREREELEAEQQADQEA